jgi:hypothetical protein
MHEKKQTPARNPGKLMQAAARDKRLVAALKANLLRRKALRAETPATGASGKRRDGR